MKAQIRKSWWVRDTFHIEVRWRRWWRWGPWQEWMLLSVPPIATSGYAVDGGPRWVAGVCNHPWRVVNLSSLTSEARRLQRLGYRFGDTWRRYRDRLRLDIEQTRRHDETRTWDL